MKYDCIFINGDSYSEKKSHKVYGDFLSDALNIPVKNYAISGSNNRRILRSSVEYLTDLKKQYQNPLVIIGWSFVRRQEVWYYGEDQQIINRVPDNAMSRLVTLDTLLTQGLATFEQKAMVLPDLHVHKQLTDFYTDLFLFSNFLKFQGIDYFWFSAGNNTDCPTHSFPYLNSLDQVTAVKNDPNIFKLHEFCILNWAKENDPDCRPVTGHLSEQGHQKFAEMLLKLYNIPT